MINRKHIILFVFILIVGILPRIWAFGTIPADLHQDEVGNGIDSYYLSHYGYDRTGITYPVHFIAWGDGSSALYSYVAIPFIKIFGLNPTTIRLPNLLAGILIIPLSYLIGKKLKNKTFGLIAMFLVAISPWNIMGSRYALEPYFVPFLFTIGFLLLLHAQENLAWLLAAMVFFSLSLYAYSTTFSVLPIFLTIVFFVELKEKKLHQKFLFLSLLFLAILSLPIILFVIINTFKLAPLQIGNLSIPRLPIEARYQTLVAIFQPDAITTMLNNALVMARVLWYQTDGWYRNVLPPFGYLYPLAPVIAIAGVVLIIKNKDHRSRDWIFTLGWLFACLSIGILQTTNFNRMALIYIPITYCVAYLLYFLHSKWKIITFAWSLIYLSLFLWFCSQYFGSVYQNKIKTDFNQGLLAAIQNTQYSILPVCFSDSINTAYMYVLYVYRPDPREFIRTIGKINSGNPFRDNHPLTRYKFGYSRCADPDASILIHRNSEVWMGDIHHEKIKMFGVFTSEYPDN